MGNTDEGRCTIDVEKIITQQIAAGILEKIPLEEKEALLLRAIKSRLNDHLIFLKQNLENHLTWSLYEIRHAIEAEGLAMAGEYIKTPAVQELVREKAVEVVNTYVDGLLDLLGKGLE